MGEFFDPLNALLCDEKSKDLCFDDDYNDESISEPLINLQGFNDFDDFNYLFERENDYLPNQDYPLRLRSGDLDLNARNYAFDWIFKAHSYYSFGPLTLCLAVNYLDRFYSTRELPRDKAWAVQLLAVACFSIAAKFEETCVPPSIQLQVGDPKYVFEAKTIQRMELLVLDTLNWKMNAITPCSFLDFSLKKLSNPHSITDKYLFSTTKVVNRSMQLILCTIKGIDYLEFRPSEIAAAAAITVSAEIQSVDIDNASSCFGPLEKDRVLKCTEMIKEMSKTVQQGVVPNSPMEVLDAKCFSFKSDELTSLSRIGTCSNSSEITTTTTSPKTKRIRLDPASTLDS